MSRKPSLMLAKAIQEIEMRKARSSRSSRTTSGQRGGGGGQHNRRPVDVAAVFHNELSDLKEGTGEFVWACCPFHDDHNPSFCVNLESGWYKCHATHCGETGLNIVSFVSALHGLNFVEAHEYLETHYG